MAKIKVFGGSPFLKTLLISFLVDSGEKLGFQVTLLLTVVIYIDYLQNNIPVFDSIGQTPNLLIYFVVLILLMTLALLGKFYSKSS